MQSSCKNSPSKLNFAFLRFSIGMFFLLFLPTACGDMKEDTNTSVVSAAMSVSYPVLGTLVIEKEKRALVFVNILDESRRKIINNEIDYVGIEDIPGHSGSFLVISKEKGISKILTYDYNRDKFSELYSTEKDIIKPFMISGKACALQPTMVTQKGYYEFEVLCSGGVNSSQGLITIANQDYSSADETAFIGIGNNGKYYLSRIYIKDGIAEIEREILPDEAEPFFFYLEGDLYIFDRAKKEMYVLVKGNFVKKDNEQLRDYFVAAGRAPGDLLSISKDHAVFARADYSASEVTVLVFLNDDRDKKVLQISVPGL